LLARIGRFQDKHSIKVAYCSDKEITIVLGTRVLIGMMEVGKTRIGNQAAEKRPHCKVMVEGVCI
jgi:hypothetical protein